MGKAFLWWGLWFLPRESYNAPHSWTWSCKCWPWTPCGSSGSFAEEVLKLLTILDCNSPLRNLWTRQPIWSTANHCSHKKCHRLCYPQRELRMSQTQTQTLPTLNSGNSSAVQCKLCLQGLVSVCSLSDLTQQGHKIQGAAKCHCF